MAPLSPQVDLRRTVEEKVLALDLLASRSSCSLPPPFYTQGDLRRAVEEKVLALDLLASAERKLVEQQADSGGWVGGVGGGTW